MTLALLEEAVDNLSVYIQANMAAKVAALNARYGDSLLTAPTKYYVGALPQSTPEAVSMAFHGEGWSPVEQRVATLYFAADISIVVFIGDADPEQRFRKLCRYALGLAEMLRSNEYSSGYVAKLRSPIALTESLETQSFLQGVIVPVTLEKAEFY